MMILGILCIVLTCICAIWMPRVAVAAVTLAVALALAYRFDRVARRLLADPSPLDYDRPAGRAERRLMRAGLRLAIAKTELRSLLPTFVSYADEIVAPSHRLSPN